MEIYVKITFIFIFCPFFWFSNMILSNALILPLSQLQTQQVMTSLISSRIDYLIRTFHLCARFAVEINEKSNLNGGC